MKALLLFFLFSTYLLSNIAFIEKIQGEGSVLRYNKDLKVLEEIAFTSYSFDKRSFSEAKKLLSLQVVQEAIKNVNSGDYSEKDLTIATREDVVKAKKIVHGKKFKIYKQDILVLKENSFVSIVFKDGTKAFFRGEAKVKIFDFRYGKSSRINLRVMRGNFQLNFGEIGRVSPENIVIQTPQTVISPKSINSSLLGSIEQKEKILSLQGKFFITNLKKKHTIKKNQFFSASSVDSVKIYRSSQEKEKLFSLFKEKKSIHYSFNLKNETIQY